MISRVIPLPCWLKSFSAGVARKLDLVQKARPLACNGGLRATAREEAALAVKDDDRTCNGALTREEATLAVKDDSRTDHNCFIGCGA